MEGKQGFFSALKEEVVRGLSSARSRAKSPARSASPMSSLLRRRRGRNSHHHVAQSEQFMVRSGSLRPAEALSPLKEGPNPDGVEGGDGRMEGRWAHWMKGQLVEFGQMGHSGDADFAGIDGGENGVMGLGFEYDGDGGEDNFNGNNERMREDGDNGFAFEEVEPNGANINKKRKMLKRSERKALGFLANQLGQLKDMEVWFEQREAEREHERQRRENFQIKLKQDWERKLEEREKGRQEREKTKENLRRQMLQEWEAIEKESDERERRRREEELIRESEWEDRINRRRSEWRKRIDEMLSQHWAEMGQMQTRILHEQQSLTSQLLGIVSQWTILSHLLPSGTRGLLYMSSNFLLIYDFTHLNNI